MSLLFVNQPDVDLLGNQGHLLTGSSDASVDIVSISLTFRWLARARSCRGRAKTCPAIGSDATRLTNLAFR
ncbi:MAG TPA: hypothetical protein VGG02_02385 [Chthoniobacterales bacterium]